MSPAGFEEFNYHRLTGKGLTVQELTETVEAMPMMAQNTFVTVTDMDVFKLDEAQRTALVSLLEDFPEYCTLVFLYRQIPYKKDGKMKKSSPPPLPPMPQRSSSPPGPPKAAKWVRRRFAAFDKELDDNAIDHLLFTCGSLMDGLVPEINKIAAYTKGQRVTVADIDAVADPVLDARIFDMTNAVTARDYDRAAAVLAELFRMQTEPIAILAALSRELRQLYTARLALDGKKDAVWVKELWRMTSAYPATKADAGRPLRVPPLVSGGRAALPDAGPPHEVRAQHGCRGALKLFLMELAGAR